MDSPFPKGKNKNGIQFDNYDQNENISCNSEGYHGTLRRKNGQTGGGSGNPNLPSAQTNYDSPSQSVHRMNKISKIIATFIQLYLIKVLRPARLGWRIYILKVQNITTSLTTQVTYIHHSLLVTLPVYIALRKATRGLPIHTSIYIQVFSLTSLTSANESLALC